MVRKQQPKGIKSGSTGIPDGSLAAFLFLATLAAYLPALQGALLWDDDQHVTQPAMQSLDGLGRIWFNLGSTLQYYPLLHSAFWLEHMLWGDSVLGYHLLNVALHAGSALLVVLIVRRLGLPGAWLAGFLFALHPVCVEAVAWISEQKSTLSGVFVLGSVLIYLDYDQTRRKWAYFAALMLFVLALLSKTTAATLPAGLLVILWWRRGRLDVKRDVLPLLPWFAIAIPAGLLTAWVERRFIGAQGVEFALSFQQRVLLAGRGLWFYAAKAVLPVDLIFSYPRWKLDPAVWWQWLFPAGVLVLAVALVVASRKSPHKTRGPLAAFLLFAGTLFPALGFVNVYPFRYSYVADHFQYVAMLGLLIPLASIIEASNLRMAASIALAAILGILTFRQTANYTDSETLYRATESHNPDSWLAHNNLGVMLAATPGRLSEAIAEYQEALRIEPDYPEAHNNLGRALSHIPGRFDDAAAEFRTAVRLRPGMAQAHLGLGNALAQMGGHLEDAASEYRAVLKIDADSAEAHFNLGNVLAQMPGELPNAIAEYQAAQRIRPDLDAAREMIEQLGGANPVRP
jgi:tetratricopeptide (TPR) repeat protein